MYVFIIFCCLGFEDARGIFDADLVDDRRRGADAIDLAGDGRRHFRGIVVINSGHMPFNGKALLAHAAVSDGRQRGAAVSDRRQRGDDAEVTIAILAVALRRVGGHDGHGV